MRKLLATGLFTLVASIAFADGTVIRNSKSGYATPVPATIDDLTLYVRSAGNDANDCLTVGNACLTFQEAVDRVPKQIKHDVVVDGGEGNFAGVMITGFHIEYQGSLTLEGTLGNFSPATGTATGTADGGDTFTCIDSGQTWTANDLRGALMLVNGEWRVIRSNDATTVNLVGPLGGTCNGEAYIVQEQKTVLNSAGTQNGSGRLEAIVNAGNRDNFYVNDIKTSGGTFGLYVRQSNIPTINRLRCTGSTYGALFQAAHGESKIYDTCFDTTASATLVIINTSPRIHTIERMLNFGGAGNGCWVINTEISAFNYIYADDMTGSYAMTLNALNVIQSSNIFISNASSAGLLVTSSNHLVINNLVVDTCGSDCVRVYETNAVDFDNVDISDATGAGLVVAYGTAFVDVDSGTIEDNGTYGIKIDENVSGDKAAFSFVNLSGTITIQNNTSGGVIALNNSVVALTNVDGAGNGNYGLELETGSYATITTDTGITGATGDATINDGTTTLTWATHFDDDRDIAVNTSTGSRIERKD